MNKNDLNYWVDAVMLLAFLAVGVTGLSKFLALRGFLLSVDYIVVSIVHDYSGVVLVLTVAFHLILHFSWIVATTKRKLGISRPSAGKPKEPE
jgi:hypothetical protein